eukprot:COSAG06_NODE_1432_length_9478_cov_5.092014_9_plen_381_part_00
MLLSLSNAHRFVDLVSYIFTPIFRLRPQPILSSHSRTDNAAAKGGQAPAVGTMSQLADEKADARTEENRQLVSDAGGPHDTSEQGERRVPRHSSGYPYRTDEPDEAQACTCYACGWRCLHNPCSCGIPAPRMIDGPARYWEPEVRRGFVVKVYGILLLQLLLTFGMVFVAVFVDAVKERLCGGLANVHPSGGCKEMTETLGYTLTVCLVLSFVFICALSCCPKLARRVPHNYAILFFFTLCEGFVISIICLSYNAVAVGIAAGMTCVVVLGLSAFAASPCAGDFTGCTPWLLALGLAYVAFQIAAVFLVDSGISDGQVGLAGVGCAIFSLYMVHDTQQVIGGKHRHTVVDVDDYVYAALSIYLDIINMFLFFLQITASRD